MIDDDGGEALLNRTWRGASCFPALIPVIAFVLASGGAAAARPGAAAGPMSVPGPPPFLPAVHGPPPPTPVIPPHTPGTPRGPANPHIPFDKAQGAQSADAADRADAKVSDDNRISVTRAEQAKSNVRANPKLFETDENGALAVRNEILAIGFRPISLERFERAGFKVLRANQINGASLHYVVLAKDGAATLDAIKELRRIDPKGTYDYNHIFSPSGSGSRRVMAKYVPQPIGQGREVGLIDTGVQRSVAPLKGAQIIQRAFASQVPIPANHGTQVASILLFGSDTNAIGKLYVADVYGNKPTGGSADLLVAGLAWMASEQVPVVNVSLVGPSNKIVAAVISSMIDRGHLIVAPVGNDGPQARPLYPASYPRVISVSAVNDQGRLLTEASRVNKVDFVAPGIAIAPDINGRLVSVRGTSFAAPVVSRRLVGLVSTLDRNAARNALRRLAASAVRRKSKRDSENLGAGELAP